jgi:hypothetical protein
VARFAALLALVGALVGAAAATAAAPVPGGEYRFAAKVGVNELSMHLILANDGREAATYSWLAADLRCPGTGYSDGEPLDGRWYDPWRAMQITPAGRFSFRSVPRVGDPRLIQLHGRFVGDGRVATGILDYRAPKNCPSLRVAFRATLYSRPNAPHPSQVSRCDRAKVGFIDDTTARDETYGVYERDVGCTSARETARRWHSSAACSALQAGETCRVPGASCAAVRGGEFNVLVSVRCTLASKPGGLVELVHYQPCLKAPRHTFASPDALILTWAVNTDCAAVAAFPLDTLLGNEDGDLGPCDGVFALEGTVTCQPVGDYLCRARPDGDLDFNARCVDSRDPFKAVEITFLD